METQFQPPPQENGAQPPIFGLCQLWPKGLMDQNSTWHAGRPRPRPHCVRLSPAPSQKKGAQPHQFSAHVYCARRSPISATAEHLFKLWPYFFINCCSLQNNICLPSDDGDEKSTVPRNCVLPEAETKRRESRGIWSLAEMAAGASSHASTATTTTLLSNSYCQFRPYLSNSAPHQLTPASGDVIRSLPVIFAPEAHSTASVSSSS